jgi:tetratricopeptide (TPR) repeat protein
MTRGLLNLRRLGSLWLAVLALALLAAPLHAQDDPARKAMLDKLFAELKHAPNAATAHAIDQQIWLIWMTPADPKLAARMADVIDASGSGQPRKALELLNSLVEDYPTYAEGWNQRATVEYELGDFDASLADIDKVLQFEPRHFGALSGRALIHLAQGKRVLAIKDIQEALKYHPFLAEKQLFPELEDMTRI